MPWIMTRGSKMASSEVLRPAASMFSSIKITLASSAVSVSTITPFVPDFLMARMHTDALAGLKESISFFLVSSKVDSRDVGAILMAWTVGALFIILCSGVFLFVVGRLRFPVPGVPAGLEEAFVAYVAFVPEVLESGLVVRCPVWRADDGTSDGPLVGGGGGGLR